MKKGTHEIKQMINKKGPYRGCCAKRSNHKMYDFSNVLSIYTNDLQTPDIEQI